MQWSTGKAGDFLITAWLEDCEVGGCAKACSVQVNAPHQLRWLCAGTISLAQSTHMPRTSSGGFVLVLYLSHSLLTCPAPAQVALCWYYISRTVYSHAPHQLR